MSGAIYAVRVPPSDIDAEAAVLSAILLDPPRLDDVPNLRSYHFHQDQNRRIFEAIEAVSGAGRKIDIVTVAGVLRDTGRLEQVGGSPYLAELSTATPFVLHIADHAKLIIAQWQKREELRVGQLLIAGGVTSAAARSMLEAIEKECSAEPACPELAPLSGLLGPALERAERRRSGVDVPVPVPWPAYADALGGGFWAGAHFITAGTAVGKSQLTIQTGLTAALAGIPVIYIGLELDEAQIALRVLGEHAGLSWSSLYQGRCSLSDLEKARAAASSLEELPFYADFGPPRGWPISRLEKLIRLARAKHPEGPLLVVLDYLQLVGADSSERRPELRELVGSAAYAARDVARRFDASVVVVSSAARAHYGLLASDAKDAGLCTRKVPGFFEPIRAIAHPHVLVGLRKESGEVEFSADTVTTLIRWPAPLETGETAVICAVPKVRCGIPRWFAMSFAGRFTELPFRDIDELPEVAKRGGRGKPVATNEREARVLETVRQSPNLTSKTQIADKVGGTKGVVLKVVGELIESGQLFLGPDGFEVRGEQNR